jgi:hypothetical protein
MKVGDYVRTKYGEICKLKKSRFEDLVYETDIEIDRHNDRDSNDYGFDSNTIQDIIKSSPNIIDLIELRDIVELFEEDDIDGEITGYYEVLAYTTDRKEIGVRNKNGETDWYPSENLRGIITWEQIASMEYKVKE